MLDLTGFMTHVDILNPRYLQSATRRQPRQPQCHSITPVQVEDTVWPVTFVLINLGALALGIAVSHGPLCGDMHDTAPQNQSLFGTNRLRNYLDVFSFVVR